MQRRLRRKKPDHSRHPRDGQETEARPPGTITLEPGEKIVERQAGVSSGFGSFERAREAYGVAFTADQTMAELQFDTPRRAACANASHRPNQEAKCHVSVLNTIALGTPGRRGRFVGPVGVSRCCERLWL